MRLLEVGRVTAKEKSGISADIIAPKVESVSKVVGVLRFLCLSLKYNRLCSECLSICPIIILLEEQNPPPSTTTQHWRIPMQSSARQELYTTRLAVCIVCITFWPGLRPKWAWFEVGFPHQAPYSGYYYCCSGLSLLPALVRKLYRHTTDHRTLPTMLVNIMSGPIIPAWASICYDFFVNV